MKLNSVVIGLFAWTLLYASAPAQQNAAVVSRPNIVVIMVDDMGFSDIGFTMMTGKWHVGFDDEVNPRSRGFDRSLNLASGGVHFSNQTGSKGNSPLYLNGEKIDADDAVLNPPWYAADLWTDQGIRFKWTILSSCSFRTMAATRKPG